jgi:hypothetical protein
MSDANPTRTPLNPGLRLQVEEPDDPEVYAHIPYREAIGSIMYAMTSTRPDIAFAVGLVSRYLNKPRVSHWKAVRQILAYIKGTLDVGLVFGGHQASEQMVGYSDADWGNDLDTRRSVSGMAFVFAGAAVSWKSRRQATVALSSTEAEYIAAAEATAEAVWLQGLLDEIGVNQIRPTRMFEDNHGVIKLSRNDCEHTRTKHVDIKYKFVREKVQAGQIVLEAVPSEKQAADVLTKPLGRNKHWELCRMLGMTRRAEVLDVDDGHAARVSHDNVGCGRRACSKSES